MNTVRFFTSHLTLVVAEVVTVIIEQASFKERVHILIKMICSYDEHVAKCMVSVMTYKNQWYVMNQWYQKPVISHLTGYCVFLTSILVGCVVMSLQMSMIRKETCNRRLSLWNLSFWHKALEDKRRWHISCMAWFLRYFYCVFLVASSSCHYRNKLSEYSRVYLTGVPSQYPCIVLSWVAQAFKAGLVRVQIWGEGRFSTPVSTGHSPCRSSASESLDEGGMERARGEPQAWLCSPAHLGSPDPVLASFLPFCWTSSKLVKH